MNRWCRWEGGDLILRLQVQPRASKDGFAGAHGDRLKVRVAAPPVEDQANDRLIAFLAKQFGVAKGRVVLMHGRSGKAKLVRIVAPGAIPPNLPMAPAEERGYPEDPRRRRP